MKHRWYAFGLAAALAALAQGASAQEGGTLKKIKDTGTVNVAYRESSIPFSYLDDNQKPVGYSMDICGKIVDALKAELKMPGLKVEYTPVSSATRIPLIANGTVDLECGSTTNNADRQKQVSFAPTMFLTASRFVTKKSSGITTIDGLKGKTVVSTAGTTNIRQLNDVNNARKLGINVVSAKDHAEGFLMVETDRAAAFVMDDILLSGFVAGSRNPDAYVIPEDAFSLPEPYGIIVRREDPAFKKVVDDAVGTLFKGPDGAALYKKWFQSPIPPRGLNLNVPMAPALVRAFAKPSDSPDPASY